MQNKIKLLKEEIVNQIAAGEIVHAPFSALKEIIENSIDANSGNIDVFIKNGGKSKIVVTDDGDGMSHVDLEMCILRHATSKLSGHNLFEIRSYGFRGEAIPSIASVSDFSIESNGNGIRVNFSSKPETFLSKIDSGTRVCIEDLFSRIPARLKFMKSDCSELEKCLNIVENFALTKHDVNFIVRNEDKTILSFQEQTLESRVSDVYSKDILDKALYFAEESQNVKVSGYLFHPSHSRHSSRNSQRLFVNGRAVTDKMVSYAAKIGYRNIVEQNRYPMTLLFIEIDPFFVDINVSPNKGCIKFRDEKSVQRFLVHSITKNVQKFDRVILDFPLGKTIESQAEKPREYLNLQKLRQYAQSQIFPQIQTQVLAIKPPDYEEETRKSIGECFFGKAIAQIFDTYIIAYKQETSEIIIIDQHAVHEKITMNKMLEEINRNNVQYLIKPEVVPLLQTANLKSIVSQLEECGFKIDVVGSKIADGNVAVAQESIVIIRAIPGVMDVQEALQLVSDIINEDDPNLDVLERIKKRIADAACHNSMRAGKKLSLLEMDEILDTMDKTRDIHQCNHHRPSFLKLSKSDIDKMFERR